MEIKRVETFSELDKVLPLMFAAHASSEFNKGKPFTAYLADALVKLPFKDQFAMLAFKEDDKVVGFVIAEIGKNKFDNHCIIADAYMEKTDEEATGRAYDMINLWALENDCVCMEAFSMRATAICRKYGFEKVSEYLRKQL